MCTLQLLSLLFEDLLKRYNSEVRLAVNAARQLDDGQQGVGQTISR